MGYQETRGVTSRKMNVDFAMGKTVNQNGEGGGNQQSCTNPWGTCVGREAGRNKARAGREGIKGSVCL